MPSVTTAAAPLGARERSRRAMLDQIAEIAVGLFAERGFEATTIDDICAASGISRTTFFRYFPAKEDVLARVFDDLGDALLAELRSRPASERPWTALRRALLPLADRYAAAPGDSMRAVRLVIESPALATFHQDKLARWSTDLVPELATRLGIAPSDGMRDPRPRALIAAGFGCLDAALTAWVASDGATPLPELLETALGAFD